MQVVPLLGFVTLTTKVIPASWKERSGAGAGEQGQDKPQRLMDLILNPSFSFELKSHILFGPQCFFFILKRRKYSLFCRVLVQLRDSGNE